MYMGVGFNTSHVTINLVQFVYLCKYYCFNTSHVTINRSAMPFSFTHGKSVSIHLMLLLIASKLFLFIIPYKFQYISCYY